MNALDNTLLAALASAGLNLAVALPVFVLAVKQAKPRRPWLLGLFAAVNILEWFVLMMPRHGPFVRLDWNWQGKLLEIAWPALLFFVVPGLTLAHLGLRVRPAPGSWKPLLLAGAAALGISAFLLPHMGGHPDRETLLFELSMPGLGEELVFRGAFQSLLNEVFGKPWRILGAELGWGFVISTLLFTTGHGLLMTPDLRVRFVPFAMLPALLLGPILGWMRERSGSIWPCILVHNTVDTLTLFL
jgi:hypothetical protein